MSTATRSTPKNLTIASSEKQDWTDEAFMSLSEDGHRYEIVLDGEEVIPGFLLPVADLFQPLSF
jgi:hypothetical protein